MASSTLTDDPVLARVRKGLDEMYGQRLERVMLYGSRARGDAHSESDYDVAVFIRDMSNPFSEMKRLADLSIDILDDTGEFVHAMPYPAGSHTEETGLMLGIRKDGIDL